QRATGYRLRPPCARVAASGTIVLVIRGGSMQEFNDSTPADVVRYPMVPIRDVVVFPHTMARFVIGRPASVHALEAALASDRLIFLSTQHDATIDEPTPEQ